MVAVVSCRKPDTTQPTTVPDAGPLRAHLISVGPSLLSNQTTQPLSITGERLVPGLSLHLGAPVNRDLALVVTDAHHGWARLPAGIELGAETDQLLDVSLSPGDGSAQIRLINDTGFPDLVALALAPDEKSAFAVSTTTDTVFSIDLATQRITSLHVGDGPTAIAVWNDATGPWLVVAHQYTPELRLINLKTPDLTKVVPAPANASGLAVSTDGIAYVAEQARDTVSALSLREQGKEVWRTPVLPNPRELALTPKGLVVGSLQSGALELLDVKTGVVTGQPLEPGPGTPIIGGGTAAFSSFVMNGKAPRAFAYSAKNAQLFVASIGPNIGPNPQKMEVSMNGGVGVVDLTRGWQRHLGFGAGVTEALALDDARGLLYASDVGLGLVRVIDVKKLLAPAKANSALLQEVALPVADGFPLIRPAADFTVHNRAGPSLHSGPKAMALTRDGRTLWVLERFTGNLAKLDVSIAGKAEWKSQFPVVEVLAQKARRLGQVLYYADLGRTAMSCDACHLEGHGEGVLFEKTMPLRIYRSTSVRGSRETPPYFTPASTRSMGETSKIVGGRNRFHNPDPSPEEIEALTIYASTIPVLPNPFVGADGAPVENLRLPDGHVGHPRKGVELFEGKAECASCHPAPVFTMDQDPATRGKFIDVGTPKFMPLREPMQNTRFEGFGTPSLLGSWDVFPMLTTGLAGMTALDDGRVRVDDRFPLRAAVTKWAPTHGHTERLTPEEIDDLLAYVMSL